MSTGEILRYSVVVPVYNEGANIGRFCELARNLLPAAGEFLFVYDFEEDDTLEALAQIPPEARPERIHTVRNRGRGARDAIVTGMETAAAPVIVVMMADLSDDFAKVDAMIRLAEEGADVVCASRYVRGGEQIGGPRLKGALSRAAGLTLHWLAGLPVHDPTNSFKAYRRAFLERTPVESTAGFALSLELTVKAHFAGGRVEEVPAVWTDRSAGTSRFRLARWLPHYLRWYGWALRERWRGPAAAAASLLVPLIATLLLIPWHPLDDSYPRERSWAMVLHLAFLRGLAFGREIVFSFGPWGFLWRGYHPDTYPIVLAGWALFAFAFVESIWHIARVRASRHVAAVATALAATVVLFKGHESLLMTLPILWYLAGRERIVSPRFLLLTIATSLAALGKFSLLLLLAPLAALLAADEILRRRRFPLSLAAIAGALLGWWTLARQSPGDLGPFLRNAFELAAGYGDAMGLGSRSIIAPLTAFDVGAGLLLAALIAGGRAAGRKWIWLDVLAVANASFFALKSGFVRWDAGHVSHAWGAIILLMIVVTLLVWPVAHVKDSKVPLLAALMTIAVSAGTILDREDRNAQRFTRALTGIGAIAGGGWSEQEGALRAELRRFVRTAESAAADLPLQGSVDVYHDMASAVAFRPGYAPRPIPQSYAAVSARLAGLNAGHLRESGADQILLHLAPIDERFPAIEDSLSWPELLARYELAARGDRYLLLERREQPRELLLRALEVWNARPGEAIAVPAVADPLWVEIDVQKSLLGRVASLLLRAPAVTMRVETADGRERDFRLPLDLAAGGFLLSPVLADDEAVARLLEQTENPARRATGIRIFAPAPFFEPRIGISFATIECAAACGSTQE